MTAMRAIEKGPSGGGKYITFRAGEAECAVDIKLVQTVITPPPISKMPNVPSFVEGVIDLRGTIVPVLDLRKRFGFGPAPKTELARIIVAQMPEGTLGFLVDAVNELVNLGPGDFREPPRMISGIDAEYIERMGRSGDRLLIVLNLSKTLTPDERKQIAR